MSNYNMNGMNNHMADMAEYPGLYPETYRRMAPNIEYITDGFNGEMTDGEIERMANELVKSSGMVENPPMGHNINTLNDMARIIILNTLYDSGGDNAVYGYDMRYCYPILVMPSDNGPVHLNSAQFGVPPYNEAQFSVPHYDMPQYGAPQHNTAQNNAMQNSTAPHNSAQNNVPQNNAPQLNSAQSSAPQRNASPNAGMTRVNGTANGNNGYGRQQ